MFCSVLPTESLHPSRSGPELFSTIISRRPLWLCSLSLPHCAMGWSTICAYEISWSCSFTFMVHESCFLRLNQKPINVRYHFWCNFIDLHKTVSREFRSDLSPYNHTWFSPCKQTHIQTLCVAWRHLKHAIINYPTHPPKYFILISKNF